MHQAVEDFTCISQSQNSCRWTEEVPLPRDGSLSGNNFSPVLCVTAWKRSFELFVAKISSYLFFRSRAYYKKEEMDLFACTHSLSSCAVFQNAVRETKTHAQKWPRGWYLTFAQGEWCSIQQCSLSLKTQQGKVGRISISGLGSVSFMMSSIPDTAISCPSWWSPTHLELL